MSLATIKEARFDYLIDLLNAALVKRGLGVIPCPKCSKKVSAVKPRFLRLSLEKGTASPKARKPKKQRRQKPKTKGRLEEPSSSNGKKQPDDVPVTVT